MILGTNNHTNYAQTREFSNQTLQASIDILESQTSDLIEIASHKEDCTQGIDLHAILENKSIAVRIRHSKYIKYYGELTVRSKVVYGGHTEVEKWHNGIMADWVFYGFEDHNHIEKWVLLDQKKLWEMMGKTFEDCQLKVNHDGTEFYAIPWKYYKDCIIDRSH